MRAVGVGDAIAVKGRRWRRRRGGGGVLLCLHKRVAVGVLSWVVVEAIAAGERWRRRWWR